MSSKREDSSKTQSTIRGAGVSEEAAIFNTFMLVIRNKFIATPESPNHEGKDKMKRLDELYSSSSYDAEKKKLTEINSNGMAKGLAAGACCFIFLRSGPRLMTRYISRNRSTGGVYHFDVRSPSKPFESRLDPDIPTPGILLRTIKFGIDVLASLTVAMYASAYFTDTNKLLNDLADIPLVEGRSLISDELCDDFTDVYKSIPKRTWDKYDGKSEPLDAIGKFVRNCIRRQAVEKRIIEENSQFGSFGIDNQLKHIEIPYPGVPSDMEVDVPWVDKSQDVETERNDSEFDGDDASLQDDFWNDFDNLSSEQEEPKDNKRK